MIRRENLQFDCDSHRFPFCVLLKCRVAHAIHDGREQDFHFPLWKTAKLNNAV